MKNILVVWFVLIIIIVPFRSSLAQTKIDSLKLLEEKIDLLAREIQNLKMDRTLRNAGLTNTQSYGLGPSSGKVYNRGSGVSIAGYGEMLYQNFSDNDETDNRSEKSDQIDFYRQVFFFGYRFNNRFLFNSEIEYEHGSTGNNGEVSVEFAYLDYIISNNFNLRAGMLLSPLGIINEYHEPPTWFSTTRPLAETYIIPTTWRGNGVGILGNVSGLEYKFYVTEGLNATGFSGQKMLRGGRQKGSKAIAEKFTISASVEYALMPGFRAGISGYYGDSGQNIQMDDQKRLEVPTTIYSLHIKFENGPLHIRALYAGTVLGNTHILNEYLQNNADDAIGARGEGYYITTAYNILPLFKIYEIILSPYLHYEFVNTQKEMASGYTQNDAYIVKTTAIGLGFKPITEIIIKADYRIITNELKSGVNQFNIVLGFMF